MILPHTALKSIYKCSDSQQTNYYYNNQLTKMNFSGSLIFNRELFSRKRTLSNVSSEFGDYDVHSQEYAEYYMVGTHFNLWALNFGH